MKRADFRGRMHQSSTVYVTSGPDVLELGTTHAVIGWSLNVTASGIVDYGTTSAYGTTTNPTYLGTDHQVTIPEEGGTDLSAGTLYHYRVRGADANGQTYDSGDRTFTTTSATTSDFLTRPASGALFYENISNADIVIENKTFAGSDPYNVWADFDAVVHFRNVHGSITIRDCDFANVRGGILTQECSGTILIEGCRGRNIGRVTADWHDIGSGGGAYVQLATSQFEGNIRNNKFLGGQTQDMISTWHAGGYGDGRELIIENNNLQGVLADTALVRRWQTRSGTGTIMSDGQGHPYNGNIIVRNNTYLNCGQSVIQHIDGPNLETHDNYILAEEYVLNNTPYGSWEGNPTAYIHDNTYFMWRPNNWPSDTPDYYVLVGPYFAVGSITEENNTQDTTLDPNDYVVTL